MDNRTSSRVAASPIAERALGGGETMLRQLIQHMPAAVAMFDKDMRYLQASERWLTDYRLTGKDVVGRSHYEIFPDIPERWKEVHRRVLAGAVERCDEDPYPHADGSVDWLEWEVQPWRRADGEIAGLVMFTQLVTKRKRAELETQRLAHDLGERVKELTLLHRASRLLEGDRPVNRELLADLVAMAPPAWQYPEICEARITYGDLEVHTPGFRDAPWRQTARFTTRDGRAGAVEIVYREARPFADEGPFLDEERSVLLSLAGLLAAHVERKRAEDLLRGSEDRFRSALQHSPIGMAIVAPDGAWIEVNPALCHIVGYTRDELLGTDARAVTHPDDLAEHQHLARRMLERAISSYQMDTRYLHRDGRTVWIQMNASLVFNPDGTPRHFIAQIQDITERRRVEEALRRAEEKFSSVFRAAPVAIAISRLHDGLFLDANREFERLFGHKREEAIGRTSIELGLWPNPEDRKIYASRPIPTATVPAVAEVSLKNKDGTLVPIRNSAYGMEIDGELCLLSAFVDLTERKRAEATLRASEARLRRVVASPILGIAFSGADGVITEANDEYLRIIGYTREELESGKLQVRQIAPPELLTASARAMHEIAAAGAGGTARQREMELLRKDGKRVPVLLGVSPLDDDRAQEVAFVFDLTERRVLERQLQHAQRMEAVGRLAAGIAHDFNNVLAAITMSSDLLRDELSAAHPGLENLLEIRKSADRAVRLIRQLLAFSRQQVLEPRVLDLNELVSNLERMLRRLIGEDVALVTRFAPSPGAVRADPGQLEQVIINLAVNARDAMPEGGALTLETASVTLDTARLTDGAAMPPGPYMMLSVRDTGTGMDAATRTKIFEPFFTTKEQGKGTGLGLSTVYGIVRQSGGGIEFSSELGRGTTFRVYLPRVEDAVDVGPAAGVPESIGGTETVLVVEDDTAVRQITRKLLVRLGYRVLDASHPNAAMDMARAYVGAIDLLLTDLVMPGGGGRALATELRAIRPRMRVLYMSGYTDDAVIRQGILGAGVAYLQKPFASTTLAHKLRSLLDNG